MVNKKEPAMRTSQRLRRCGIGLLGVALLVLAWTSNAEEPQPKADVKTPLQRLLQGDDARKARELQKRVEELAEADKYADALAAAKDLLALRERLQGAEYWEAMDARLQTKTLERRSAFNAQQQAEFRRFQKALGDANDLLAKGRYAQAQP